MGADELIAGVRRRRDPSPDGFDSALRLATEGCVYPGMIGRSPTNRTMLLVQERNTHHHEE
jgi:hypothetical protein